MLKYLRNFGAFIGLSTMFMVATGFMIAAGVHAKDYGLGRIALDAEIAKWDIDVRPDGKGLPIGSSTAKHEQPGAGRVRFKHRSRARDQAVRCCRRTGQVPHDAAHRAVHPACVAAPVAWRRVPWRRPCREPGAATSTPRPSGADGLDSPKTTSRLCGPAPARGVIP